MSWDTVAGRNAERQTIEQLLELADEPVALVLAGEAGIGKSTLWRAGVDMARQRGFTVLSSRPAAAEVRLSYSGLADLVAGVGPDRFDELPAPQRQAMDAALLRSGGGDAPEARAVAAAFLSLIDGLARRSPLLIALDDVQWLDEPSRRVVEFASRRCRGPIALLAAERIADASAGAAAGKAAAGQAELGPIDAGRRTRILVGPLSLGAMHHVVRQHLGRELPRHIVVRIAERSAGNPFYALELARSLDISGGNIDLLPDTLKSALHGRLEALMPPTFEALAAVSALTLPTVELLERVVETGDVVERLAPAEDAGVVSISAGMVEFTHPLLASVVYSELAPSARRTLHRRLSEAVGGVEERARHLALAAVRTDAETIAALDAASDHASRRGAPDAAAELLERALALGAADAERRVKAAEEQHRAGDWERATELLEAVVAELERGPLRARALALLGVLDFQRDASPRAAARLRQAIDEAAGDAALRASVGLDLCWSLVSTARIQECREVAARAVHDAERAGIDGLLSETLAVRALHGFLLGDGTDEEALVRALALEDADRRSPLHTHPSQIAGRVYAQLHRLDEARPLFETVRQRCLDRGAEMDLWLMEYWLMRTALETGDIATADRLARSYRERAALVESPHWVMFSRLAEARVHAWVGRVDEARSTVEAARATFVGEPAATHTLFTCEAWCIAQLADDNPEEVVEPALAALHAVRAEGFDEPAAFQMTPDVAEALIMLGRGDESLPLITWLEASGAKPERPWARAVGGRCRALLLAAQGEAEAAERAFTEAIAAHDRVPEARYDRGRTLLAAGRTAGRRGQRRLARGHLDEAAAMFEAVGAARWATNARAEADRLGMRPGSATDLTPAEQRVAELAAQGMTNREVGAALFVSPKTVDAHLGRVYRKLGIRSRVELARRIADP